MKTTEICIIVNTNSRRLNISLFT